MNPGPPTVQPQGFTPVGVITEALPGQTGPMETAHATRNCGQSWIEVTSPPGASVSAPLFTSNGLVLRAGADADGSALFVSHDGMQRWARHALDVPVLKERLWTLGSVTLASTQRRGVEELRVSRDRGARWVAELSRVNESSGE